MKTTLKINITVEEICEGFVYNDLEICNSRFEHKQNTKRIPKYAEQLVGFVGRKFGWGICREIGRENCRENCREHGRGIGRNTYR